LQEYHAQPPHIKVPKNIIAIPRTIVSGVHERFTCCLGGSGGGTLGLGGAGGDCSGRTGIGFPQLGQKTVPPGKALLQLRQFTYNPS
jgi:hypothetical protein